jgi:sugar phosphate isomerase/epimerase
MPKKLGIGYSLGFYHWKLDCDGCFLLPRIYPTLADSKSFGIVIIWLQKLFDPALNIAMQIHQKGALSVCHRRHFIQQSMATAAAMALLPHHGFGQATSKPRQMRMALTPGAIGVKANTTDMIRLAAKYGFEAIEPNVGYLAALADDALKALREEMQRKDLTWAAAGFPLQFRGDESAYQSSLKELPKFAASLKRAGVERVGTWLSPCHEKLTYLQNFRLHAARLREGARILGEHGLRLGLEYVGTRTSLTGRKYPFIHTLAETLDLLAEIGLAHVGFILDSWHWWQAGDRVADLLALKNAQVVSVDLNDAPAGIALDQQLDGKRELPASTGVIDVGAFLNALHQIGYDGPVRAEPFNKALNDLDDEAACAATAQAMKKAFALIQ